MTDAGYVLASLAEVYVEEGDPARAAPLARRAIELLDDRAEHLLEIGMAHLALGRALAALGEGEAGRTEIAAAAALFERTGSPSHRAEAWLAEGDRVRRAGDERQAAQLYRQAAVALQADH